MNGEKTLFEDKRNLKEIIQEVAEEEGLTVEEATKLFKQGLKEAVDKPKSFSRNKKTKNRAKNKQARKSRKRNRQ